MDPVLLRAFHKQLALQCRFVLMAAKDVNNKLPSGNTEAVFYALQNLLTAGANISKALWGQRGKLSDQRRPLRESVGIDDTSPMRQVNMRNNFEHFDDRLDRWWVESRNHNQSDLNIGPKGHSMFQADVIDMFRIFDPNTAEMTFWGEEFNLQSIIVEAEKILQALKLRTDR